MPPEEIADVGNYLVYSSLGTTYGKLEQWENCAATGRYLQHIVPDAAEGYMLVGTVSFNMGRFADASVQYIAGLLIDPDNNALWSNLNSVYTAVRVQPIPVTRQGSVISFNRDVPFVGQQVNEAAAMVVHLFEDAKQSTRARELRDQLIRQYFLSPEVFSRE